MFRLKELTFELSPYAEFSSETKDDWITFLRGQRSLEFINCKLLLQITPIESQFLNKFLRDILRVCGSLKFFAVEHLQIDVGKPQNRWDISFELLRDILASNLKSLRVRVDCCEIILSENKNDLQPWWNDSIECLQLNFIYQLKSGVQHETMATFLERLHSLRHLNLGGNLNNELLKAIWSHQKKLRGLSLFFADSSVITEAGFTGEVDETGEYLGDTPNILMLTDIEYLKIEVEKGIAPEIGLLLPPNIFKEFDSFKNLHFLSVKSNNNEPELLFALKDHLKDHNKLKGLYIKCKVEKIFTDFWFDFIYYCHHLERLYIKNDCPDSRKFSISDYKNFFRFCPSLKLLIHENERETHRWFMGENKKIPERIKDDDQIYLIKIDSSFERPEFWS